MTKEEFLKELENDRKDFEHVNLKDIDFDLRDVDLRGVSLSYADLSNLDLSGINLLAVDLSYANLSNANLEGANLKYADLYGVDLSYANLKNANLEGAALFGVDLTDANLEGANLDDSVFPLSCESLDIKVDKKIAAQLAYYFCRLNCNDLEFLKARNSIIEFANEFHNAEKYGKLVERKL